MFNTNNVYKEMSNLQNLRFQYEQQIKNLHFEITQINNKINIIRNRVAKYYENKINNLLQNESITIIPPYEVFKPQLLNKNNLIIITSIYPGFAFRSADSDLLLSDYYSIDEFSIIAEQFIIAIINNYSAFKFPFDK